MKHLDSKELILRTKTLVAQERKTTIQLITHLQEIERRMLYAKLGYSSLWEFATQELGLSEGAAQRRIQAMRLLRDVPQAKAALEDGKLSLSNAAKVQSFRQAEKRQGRGTHAELLIEKVAHLSQRDCEKVLLQISPQAIPQERERLIAASGDRELKFVVTAKLYDKIQRLKALRSHAMPDATYAQLLEYLVDQTLPRLEKKKGLISPGQRPATTVHEGVTVDPHLVATHKIGTAEVDGRNLEFSATSECAHPNDTHDEALTKIQSATAAAKAARNAVLAQIQNATAAVELAQNAVLVQVQNAAAAAEAARALPAGLRVYLPAAIRRAVWVRGNGQCEIVVGERRCQSRMRLELDHILPLALGGANSLSNLRLACWHHNQQQAREKLRGNT